MVFCNITSWNTNPWMSEVTILILIDGFLQYGKAYPIYQDLISHNPYFNRWFSAI